tara:strand:- start:5008 stop:5619 length:612 start_codon:yes stop_codon:yes gene_type:complete
VCAPDPNAHRRAQAEIRHKQKLFAWKGKNLAYKNKSALIAAKQKDVAGLIRSRNLSDLKVGISQMQGQHYKRVEVASKNMWKEMATGVGAKGGSMSRRSMLRGGTKAAAYLDKIGKSEAALELAKGRGQHILLEKQRRIQKSQDADLRQKQGLPPNFGASTYFAPVADNRGMSYLSTALSIGAMFATGGTSKLLSGAGMALGG